MTAEHNGMPAIEVSGLVKRYGKIEAVRGIDLVVHPGEIFGFLGPNGAGKSTTINILCALVGPTAGRVSVAGYDVGRRPDAVRARIGIVFQDPSLDIQLTGRENLEFCAFLYNVPRSERQARIAEALQMVQLEDRAGERVLNYSGGMRRRLEIARGLMHHPQILFLDEPTVGLDPQVRNRIWGQLRAMRDQDRITVFMTTHYMDEAEFCDRIAIIDGGQIIALGTPSELKSQVGGDTITLQSSRPIMVKQEISQRFSVEASVDGGTLRMQVDDAASFVPQLLRELGAPVTSVTISRPSLDDVFLKLTGHAIRPESGGGGRGVRLIGPRMGARRMMR